jgi:hypothetical protein
MWPGGAAFCPALTDEDFLAEDEFTIELDDFVQRFGPPRLC